jgi:Ca2+-transporting ATPase
VVMITGDYPATALNIAQQCGIDISAGSLSGSEMTALNDADLAQKIKHINVFCRVMPEQKLRLVQAFRSQKEIVAMTGDGVNDAPALKAADIGIAMGKRGTDVARESASLVLLDDDFSSMVAAIQAGRRIFDNLRKSVSFIVAIHIPIIGLSFIPVMMGWPILLMPVHILVLELLIDPTCSLVFEAETEEDDLMQRPPRAVDQSIFALPLVLRAAAEGAALLAAVIGLYWFSTGHGIDTDEARAMAFACIISGNIGLILINRSNQGDILSGLTRPNPILWWVVGLTVLIVSAALVVPALSALFFFGTPGLAHISIAIGVGILTIAVISGVHRLRQLIQASV